MIVIVHYMLLVGHQYLLF